MKPDDDLLDLLSRYEAACEVGPAPDPGAFLHAHGRSERLADFLVARRAMERFPILFQEPSTQAQVAGATETEPNSDGFDLVLGAVLGRGGMGVVYRAVDLGFGRDVAVKVLRGDGCAEPDLARRFEDEARITGSLQHPGIPPVYRRGRLPDGRPFLAMKLIAGRTFADLLAARTSPHADRAGQLLIFEAICQTMAYAHERGVIHRDLKPANVMVGAFGEVQVMDWGLAKLLTSDTCPEVDPESSSNRNLAEPGAGTVRQEYAGFTRPGSVMGTPGYMPPEQARGTVELVDRRSDVFALGAILCEILTGAPAYTGGTSAERLARAERGDLTDAFARLDACSAEGELIELARRCLALEPAARPTDAGVVARAVGEHRAGVAERLQRAERERAAAETRAIEERKRQRIRLLLFALSFVLVAVLLAGWWWFDRQAAFRQLEDAQRGAVARTAVNASLELAREALRKQRLGEAKAALEQADFRLDDADSLDLRAWHKRLARDLALSEDLERIFNLRWMHLEGKARSTRALEDYPVAFRAYDLPLEARQPENLLERLNETPIRERLLLGLEDWLTLTRDARERTTLVELINAADEDDLRRRTRLAWLREDTKSLKEITATVTREQLTPRLAFLLAEHPSTPHEERVRLLRWARHRFPDDVGAAFRLADLLPPVPTVTYVQLLKEESDTYRIEIQQTLSGTGTVHYHRDPFEESEGAYRAILFAQPNNAIVWNNLGKLLRNRGDRDGAVSAFRNAIAFDSKVGFAAYNNLGLALKARGDLPGASDAYRRAIEMDPTNGAAYNNLAILLEQQGKTAEAVVAYRKAIEHYTPSPESRSEESSLHENLGRALRAKKDHLGAVEAFRRVVALAPKDPYALHNLGQTLRDARNLDEAVARFQQALAINPDLLLTRIQLGRTLREKDDPTGALAQFRQAVRIKRDDPRALLHLAELLAETDDLAEAFFAYEALGTALLRQSDRGGALAAYCRALEYGPDRARAYNNVGVALEFSQDVTGALDAYRQAIRLDPELADPHANLGHALWLQGDYPGAVQAYREAVRLAPLQHRYRATLGFALRYTGEFAASIEALQQAHEIGSKAENPASYQYWLEQSKTLANLDANLPRLAEGVEEPETGEEALSYADLCYFYLQRYADAAALYALAFRLDKALVSKGLDPGTRYVDPRRLGRALTYALPAGARYNAACAAVRAANGEGADPPDPQARSAWRRQALDWLQADLAARGKLRLSSLGDWVDDPALASVRDAEGLKRLPAEERQVWEDFWQQVRVVRARLLAAPLTVISNGI